MSRPLFTVQTISRSTKRIMLRFKLGWKVHIHTFLEIYCRPTNLYGQRKIKNVFEVKTKIYQEYMKIEKTLFPYVL